MSERLSFSYKTNSGTSGSLVLPRESTIFQIKLQMSKILSVPADSIILSLPNVKSLHDDQLLKTLNLTSTSCFLVSTEISEIPSNDYFKQLHKKMNTKDLAAFKEIVEEWEESFDIYLLLNSENSEGWTLMHYACYKGADTIVEYLVSLNAICNSESDDSWTPLQLACYNGHTECVRHLLAHPRLQINRSTNRGTALHQACRKGQPDILFLLLDHKAEMTIEDSNGLIPLQVASSQEIFEIIPKYMGQKLISSLKSAPSNFNQVKINVSVEGVDLVMTTSLTEGKIIFYEGKSEFKAIKLIDVYDFREISPTLCIIQGKFGLIDIRMSSCQEFIKLIEKDVDYCLVNKIGFTETAEVQIPIVLNQSPSRNVSFHRVSISSFNIVSKLLSNQYTNYYSAVSRDTSHMFIVKQVPKAKIHEVNKTLYYVRESKLLQHIRHNFIARLFYAFQSKDNLYFVFEHCKHTLLDEISTSTIQISAAKVYIAQVILALEYLHSRDIIYRNLCPSNIWIDPLGNVKLLNFQLAKENISGGNKAKSFVGTLGYVPPEYFSKEGYEKAADIYALGPCLYQMIIGQPLFGQGNIREIVNNIKLGIFSFPANLPGEIKDFMSKVMQKDPNLRPNISALKKQAWLRDVNWNDLAKKRTMEKRRSILMMTSDMISEEETEPMFIEEETEFMYDEIEDFDYYGSLS